MKTDIRSYLAADSAARRLKFNTEIGKSSVQTYNQQDPPFRKIWQTYSGPSAIRQFLKKRHSETFGNRQ